MNWQLLDPAGNVAWQKSVKNDFEPFRSKYVEVGSRKNGPISPPAGTVSIQEVRLDYGDLDPLSAQIEEIMEVYLRDGEVPPSNLPALIVKRDGTDVQLPLPIPFAEAMKPK